MELKDIIRNRRLELGYRMEDLAEKVGVSTGTISRWENGQVTTMKQDKIVPLCNALNLSPSVFVDGLTHTPTDQEVTVPARDFLRLLCKSSPEALEILDRMDINANGEVNITGVDMASQAVINHQLRGLLAALKAAKIEHGKAHAEFTPNPKEATDD